jgi:hypothetical protein
LANVDKYLLTPPSSPSLSLTPSLAISQIRMLVCRCKENSTSVTQLTLKYEKMKKNRKK